MFKDLYYGIMSNKLKNIKLNNKQNVKIYNNNLNNNDSLLLNETKSSDISNDLLDLNNKET